MYIENNLSKDETVVIKAQKNPLFLLIPIIWVVIFLVVASVFTGIWGANPSYNRAAFSAVAEKTIEEGYDKADAEVKQSILEQYDVGSRGALKKAIVDQAWEQSGIAKMDGDAVSLYVSMMLKAADISGGTVFLEMVYPIISIVGWAAFAISALVFLKKLCAFLSLELATTNKRVVGKVGLLSKHVIDIHIDKVDNVQIKSSVFGNLLKYYAVQVKAASGEATNNKGNDLFVGIKNAQEFKDKTNEVIEQHAEAARKAQAEEIARAMGK